MMNIDNKIANYYAKIILKTLKHGESGIFFWWPGSGMTTIVNDIVSSKQILQDNLGNLTNSLKIFTLWGHNNPKKTLRALLTDSDFGSTETMTKLVKDQLNLGNEVCFVLGRIDDYVDLEKKKILQFFIKLISLNPRRVHLLFHSVNKPWFRRFLVQNPEAVVIANTMRTIPILGGDLLAEYIDERSESFGICLQQEQKDDLTKTYGGMLQLTKEYLRSDNNKANIDVKFRLHWDILPKEYKKEILKRVQEKGDIDSEVLQDLELFGVEDLNVFSFHSSVLGIKPEKQVLPLLTVAEQTLWKYLQKNSRVLITKETVVSILRPSSHAEISLWGIDKAISRFRKKLLKSGIDPEKLKTVKGKGYIWQN